MPSHRFWVCLSGLCLLLTGVSASGAALRAGQQPLSALPIVDRIAVPKGPAWLETAFGSVWVSKSESHVVLRIDPATNRVMARIPVGSDPELGFGVGLGSIWVADVKDRTLTRIDPESNRVLKVWKVPIPRDGEGSIAVGMGSVWFITQTHRTHYGTLARFDPASGKIIANIPVKPQSHAVLAAFDAVWVTSAGDGSVTRVDPATNQVVSEISVHAAPVFLAASAESVWVLSQGDGSLARIDPKTSTVTATVPLKASGVGGDICVADGFVWVAAEGIPLSQIDPRTNTLVRQFVGGEKDDTLRVGFGAAWIVDETQGQIWKVDLNAFSGAASAVAPAAAINAAALSAPKPDEWLTAGRDGNGTYFSPLTDINAGNVARLGFAWDYRLGTRRGLEATPIVVDGVMYASGNFGRVYAVNAATGEELWTYDPHIDGAWARYACCDAVNRGLAAFDGRLYVNAIDGWLHAIDARTGQLLWKVDTVMERQQHRPYTLSGSPQLAGELVLVGNAGGDFAGVRGYVTAYDLKTGAQRWRFYTVPRNPAEGPPEQEHLKAALPTWDPRHRWEAGSGATVWDGMAYDPVLKLAYIGTGNPAPYDSHVGGRKGGDELYSACIVAIHIEDGSMAWYYQTVPGDRWDFDSTQKLILAEVTLSGARRSVLMQAAKNGFYYVLDRGTGELLSAHNFAYVSWTKGIDPKTERPLVDDSANYDRGPALIFPSEGGAHSWQPMAYDDGRGLTFIPVVEAGNVLIETIDRPAGLVEGQFSTPAFGIEDYDPKGMRQLYGRVPSLHHLSKGFKTNLTSRGFLRAWSVAEHRVVWEMPTATSWDGGVLATAGGLVFQGDAYGNLAAYDSDTGQVLKTLQLGSSMMAAPMTYRVNGVQYVAIMAGYGGGATIVGAPLDPESAAYRYGNEGRIIVLKVGGAVPPLPPVVAEDATPLDPPPRTGSSAELATGRVLYNRYCARCHVFGRGILPDLRTISPAIHTLFKSIVLDGVYGAKGMGKFDDVLAPADLEALHDYLIDQAWLLKSTEKVTHGSGSLH